MQGGTWRRNALVVDPARRLLQASSRHVSLAIEPYLRVQTPTALSHPPRGPSHETAQV